MGYLKSLWPGCDICGVDISKKAVLYSKKKGILKVYNSSALNLPFRDETFDVVFMLDVLEHIKKQDKAILEMKRVLKKNGYLLITSPALQFMWTKHDSRQGHYRRYSKKIIIKLAERSNLNIGKIQHFNFFLSFPIIVVRLLSKTNVFDKFGEYDNKMNYDIANCDYLNNVLSKIFITEVRFLKYVNYPFGISLAALFRK